MGDEKKKEFRGHVIAMGISVAAGYFTAQVQLNELFSLPSYAYTSLSIFVGILILHRILAFIRFAIVSYRDSKQAVFPPFFFVGGRKPMEYIIEKWDFDGFKWEIEYDRRDGKIHQTTGPFCPKEECQTELNVKKTYFGRHKYECPGCAFKKVQTANSYTMESNLEKVSKARFDKNNIEGHRGAGEQPFFIWPKK